MSFYFMNYLSLPLGNLNSDTDELYLLLLQCLCYTYISPTMFSIVWCFRVCVSHVCNMKYCKSIGFYNAKEKLARTPTG